MGITTSPPQQAQSGLTGRNLGMLPTAEPPCVQHDSRTWRHTSTRTGTCQPCRTPNSGEAMGWSAASLSVNAIRTKRWRNESEERDASITKQKRSPTSTARLLPSNLRTGLRFKCPWEIFCTWTAETKAVRTLQNQQPWFVSVLPALVSYALVWTRKNLYQFNIPLPAMQLSFTEGMIMQTKLFVTSPIRCQSMHVHKYTIRTSYHVEHLLCNKFTRPVHWWFRHTWLMYKRTQLALPWKFYTYLHRFKISSYKNTQRSCLLRCSWLPSLCTNTVAELWGHTPTFVPVFTTAL